jgi:hypothetical protein
VLDELFGGHTGRGANPPRDESRSRSQHPDRPSTCPHRAMCARSTAIARTIRTDLANYDPVVARRCRAGDGIAYPPIRPRAQRAGMALVSVKSRCPGCIASCFVQPLHTYTSCFRVYRRRR